MDKVGYPRGLVRYATQSSMESASGGALAGAWQQVRASLMRPRILVYGGLLGRRDHRFIDQLGPALTFKVDVVRDRATLSRIVEGGKLENVYRLQIMNATEEVQQYRIKARGIDGLTIEDNSSCRHRFSPKPMGSIARAHTIWFCYAWLCPQLCLISNLLMATKSLQSYQRSLCFWFPVDLNALRRKISCLKKTPKSARNPGGHLVTFG
jgi:polyferredoxin